MKKNLKILFLTNVPSPYRVDFFCELGRFSELTVLYQKRFSSERNKKWKSENELNYTSIYLEGKSTGVDNAFCIDVLKYLNNSYDVIVICGNASPTEILAIEWCKLKKIPYCLEGDGAFLNKNNFVKNLLKRNLIKSSDIYLSTCAEQDKYYEYYGAKKENIFRYKFSSIREGDILLKPMSQEEKKYIRDELQVREKYVILAVGQFIYRKGYDILINAVSDMKRDIGVYIIGGTPTAEYLSMVDEFDLNNVHFLDFKSKEELSKYYKAADIFVHPTREDIWGLVINEAMSYGLPVITTQKCNAGLELIENGKNGFIIPINDVNALKESILNAIENLDNLIPEVLNRIQLYSIEKMVEEHLKILNEYVRRKR